MAEALPQPAPPPLDNGRKEAAAVPLRLPPPPAAAVPRKPTASRRPPQTAFPAPMQFSLGRPLGRPAGRAQALPAPAERMKPASYGPAAPGSLSYGQFAEVVSGHVDPSWLDQLHQWWLQHRYYPEQAAANGEDGTVVIRFEVDRYGHVHNLQREMGSGSQWLDMAAEAVFRGAHLPPLPPDTKDKTITLNLNIVYVIVGR